MYICIYYRVYSYNYQISFISAFATSSISTYQPIYILPEGVMRVIGTALYSRGKKYTSFFAFHFFFFSRTSFLACQSIIHSLGQSADGEDARSRTGITPYLPPQRIPSSLLSQLCESRQNTYVGIKVGRGVR